MKASKKKKKLIMVSSSPPLSPAESYQPVSSRDGETEGKQKESQEETQEVERAGWMKAERRWSRKLHRDGKWQALTNHCSADCRGSDGTEIIKIWLNLAKYIN